MRQAFTLVELAIVIIIIGLLVGGVLAGQELIIQAKWRSTMKEMEGYRAAMATFYGKYDCLPGDCPQGFRLLGSACGTNVTIGPSGSARNGCNGNGNKILSDAEGQLLWKHLSVAKMIKGSFTSGYSSAVNTNVNIPPSALGENTGISAVFAQGDASTTTGCGFEYCMGDRNVRAGMMGKNVFVTGSSVNATTYIRGAYLTPMDAYAFDVKFDDGIYYSGSISGFQGQNISGGTILCGNHTTKIYYNTHATYANEVRCRLVFDSGF